MQLQGLNLLLSSNGRSLTVLDASGLVFTALMSDAPMVDPATELGPDAREYCVIIVPRGSPAEQVLQMNSLVKDDAGAKWQIVKRDNSPADTVAFRFWAVRLVPGVDQ